MAKAHRNHTPLYPFMMTPQSLPWCDPLALAANIHEAYWIMLHSGVQADYSGRHSYIACHLAERIDADDFSAFASALADDCAPFSHAWFGYLGYGLKDSLETLVPEKPYGFTLPKLCMMRFYAIYVFDHAERTLTLWSHPDYATPAQPKPTAYYPLPKATNLHSPVTREAYLEHVARIIERIHAGDLYQANLTRKFAGDFAGPVDGFALFRKLCETSPAPYSAFLKLDDTAVISSSPERFLSIDATGRVTTRPIKGTAPRFADERRDRASRDALRASAKDRAENLMIVDLMRNDLSRTCEPGSIDVSALFEVTTHATIHHLSSTIAGKKHPHCSALDVVKHCFPPGSMTGAPKIKAMNLCAELEPAARGVYSGAIGWFGGDGSCDLSVAIRTLIVKKQRFEFQVGGGIVADSTPEREWRETLDKSRGILLALGVLPEALAAV